MKRKIKKMLRRAYRKGRVKGFDKGFAVAKMIFEEIAIAQQREIEKLNSELILGEEEEDD